MRNKKPNAETLASKQSIDPTEIIAMDTNEVKKYLELVQFGYFMEENNIRCYAHIRELLSAALDDNCKENVIMAALIERIARTAAYLDKIERAFFDADLKDVKARKKIEKDMKSLEYSKVQTEHRKCIEAFANLKFTEQKKHRGSVIEELRRVVKKEE